MNNPGLPDVTPEKAIAAFTEKEIIGGYADGRYGPNAPIKRGLVKAFDLPRYDIPESENSFKDVKQFVSHSSNAPIATGQVAKLMKVTEEAKPQMNDFTRKGMALSSWLPDMTKSGNQVPEIQRESKPDYILNSSQR